MARRVTAELAEGDADAAKRAQATGVRSRRSDVDRGDEGSARSARTRDVQAAARCAYSDEVTKGGAALRIKISDERQLDRLLGFLEFDPNVVVTQLAADEVEVSFLGSLNTSAQMMESELRLRLWLSSHPDVIAVMQE